MGQFDKNDGPYPSSHNIIAVLSFGITRRYANTFQSFCNQIAHEFTFTELRNCIYNYLLIQPNESEDESSSKLCVVHLRSPRFPFHRNIYCPGHQNCQWSNLRRQTLGLTQTCRAIRREFRPLYFSRLVVYLHRYAKDATKYILDFFPQAEDTYGECHLGGYGGDINCHEMLPLIQVLSKSPNFTLKYEGVPRDKIVFEALIDAKGNKQWREYVEKNATRISYFPCFESRVRRDKNQLFVNIRHTTGEPWMIEEKKEDKGDPGISELNRTPADKPECVRKWLEFAGLSHLDEVLDDVGIQVAPADEDSDSEASAIDGS